MSLQKSRGRAAASHTLNMSTGDPMRLILGFALPLLIGTLFQQFYSMVDTMIVGKMLGVEALAGVGSTGSVNFLVNGFVIGVTNGFTIPVSQCFGAENHKGVRRYVANITYLAVALAVVLTLSVSGFTRQILVLMQTPENILDMAYAYIYIIFLGIPTTILYNLAANLMRSVGDSKTPVYFLIIASLINIVLDYLSIAVLGMGVEGPALATVISQAVSGLLCLVYMWKRYEELRVRRGEWGFDARLCGRLLAVGLPMGIQYSVTAIGSVILQTAVNGLGSAAVAAISAGGKISVFCCCVFDSLGVTMATYAGQNVGAGKLERVREGVLDAMKLASVYAVAVCLVLVVAGGKIPLLFLDAEETRVIAQTHRFLISVSLFYIPLAAVNIYRFAIQGMGFSNLAILSGVCEMVARTLVAFVGVKHFGYAAACMASPCAWILADLYLLPALSWCVKSLRKKLDLPVSSELTLREEGQHCRMSASAIHSKA